LQGPAAAPAGCAQPCLADAFLFPSRAEAPPEARMIPFFVQIKCQLGKSYEVANRLADAEIASEIYSTAGEFDLLVKFYVDDGTDIGHFINEKVQTIPGIQDTRTIITFKAF
jgi:DNA-binding Lrp family transcriptional regulator